MAEANAGQAQHDLGKAEADKLAPEEGRGHGLPTPEPDEARNQAEEQRRQAASSETGNSAGTNASTSQRDDGTNSRKRKADSDSARRVKKGMKRLAANSQKKAVDDVMACNATAYTQVLGVKEGSSPDEIKKAYERLATLTDPNTNKHQNANEAHKRVKDAATKLGLDESLKINEQDVEFDEVDLDMPDAEDVVTRAEFLKKIYDDAEPHVKSLMEDPKDTEAKEKLAQLNRSIEERNQQDESEVPEGDRVLSLIDVSFFVDQFSKARQSINKLEKHPADAAAKQKLDRINKSLKEFNKEHGYPENWTLDEPQGTGTSTGQQAKTVQPGLTRKGETILAYRDMRGGQRFYVQTKAKNAKPFCKVQTSEEVGFSAAKAYLKYDEKVEVGADARKYRRKDAEKYGGIVHVACKPVHTRIEPRDKNRKPRRPPTDVCATISGQNIWITSSDLAAMLGRTDAWADIEEYYDDRSEEYPWEVPPKRVLTDKVQSGDDEDAEDSGDSDNEAPAGETPTGNSSGWTPVNKSSAKKAARKGSGTQRSKDDEIQQLKENNAELSKKIDKLTELVTALTAKSQNSS